MSRLNRAILALSVVTTMPAHAGTLFVLSTTGPNGALPDSVFKVKTDGTRTIVTNFLDVQDGPPIFLQVIPDSLAIGPDGSVYVKIQGTGPSGGDIVRVDPNTGFRTEITDYRNPAQGPVVLADVGTLAVEATGDLLINSVCNPIGQPGCTAQLLRVNPGTGTRTVCSDFGDPSKGPTAEQTDTVAVGPQGDIYVIGRVNGIIQANLYRVDPVTGQRAVVSRLGDITQGFPAQSEFLYSMAVEPSGNILLTSPRGLRDLFRIDPATGFRTIVTDLMNSAQGPMIECPGLAVDPATKAIFCSGTAQAVVAPPSLVLSIDPVTGLRSTISDFHDPAEGPQGFGSALGFVPDPPGAGDILALDAQGPTCCFAQLVRVFPPRGYRAVLSDFGNPVQGPLGGQAQSVAANASGDIFVTDSATEPLRGHVYKVNGANGKRTVLSDFGNPAQGPTGVPVDLAVAVDGSLFVTSFNPPALFRVDGTSGNRSLVSDFSNVPGGPSGVALQTDGGILVAFTDGGTNRFGALIRVDPATGQQTVLSDFGDASRGPLGFGPTSLAIEATDTILAGAFRGGTCLQDLCMALYRVDPTTGMRTLLSDSNNPAEGPTGGKANGLAVHPGLGILASACSVITPAGRFVASICTVDAVKGHRALLSDFNDPSLRETFGNGPISIAVIPAPVLTGRLTASVSPPGAGSISPPSGIYTLAANLSMKASANPGFVFSNFSGALSGSTNPQNLSLNANSTVVANFTPVAPRLSASVGVRTDGVTPGTRVVPLSLLNSGAGGATNATITSISGIAIVAGSGVVSIASGLPVNLGTIAPGASASAQIIFNWPATAARVRMTVNYTTDAGYSGSATITSFR